MRTEEMIKSFPGEISGDQDLLVRTINALVACSQTCTACADACLSDDSVAELRSCIATALDCADICAATARILSRNTTFDAEVAHALLRACTESCRACAAECDQHADHHDHCRICAEECRECMAACQDLLEAIG